MRRFVFPGWRGLTNCPVPAPDVVLPIRWLGALPAAFAGLHRVVILLPLTAVNVLRFAPAINRVLMSTQNRQHAGEVTMVTNWLRCAAGVIRKHVGTILPTM